MNLNSSFASYRFSCHCHTGNQNMQLVLQHCCKTSWIAMLRVLPPMFKPVNNLICCKTGLMWVGKRPTLLVNSFCSNVARQVNYFFLPIFAHLKLLVRNIVMKTKSCKFDFRFSPDVHRRTVFLYLHLLQSQFQAVQIMCLCFSSFSLEYRKVRTHFPHCTW